MEGAGAGKRPRARACCAPLTLGVQPAPWLLLHTKLDGDPRRFPSPPPYMEIRSSRLKLGHPLRPLLVNHAVPARGAPHRVTGGELVRGAARAANVGGPGDGGWGGGVGGVNDDRMCGARAKGEECEEGRAERGSESRTQRPEGRRNEHLEARRSISPAGGGAPLAPPPVDCCMPLIVCTSRVMSACVGKAQIKMSKASF